MELFRDFLKSEFSEENIEFWIACEEFKTIRTNKLVARAQRIYSDFIAIKAPKQVRHYDLMISWLSSVDPEHSVETLDPIIGLVSVTRYILLV